MFRIEEHELVFSVGPCRDFDDDGFTGEKWIEMRHSFKQLPTPEYFSGLVTGWNDLGYDLIDIKYRWPHQRRYEDFETFRDLFETHYA